MIIVTLASSLAAYLPGDGGGSAGGHRSITLAAETWSDTVHEIRSQFDLLGKHLFDPAGKLRAGFLVAVNDEVSRRPDGPAQVRSGDHLFLFTQMAGG